MAQDKYGYIPPSVKQAMDQHMQRMPANPQKNQSGNSYISSRNAKSMENYMNKSMPAHMKEYIKPYMEHQMTAGLSSLDPVTTRPMQPRAPAPDLMRRDHSAPGGQFSVNVDASGGGNGHRSLSFTPQYSGHQANSAPPAPPPAPLPNPATGSGQGNTSGQYDFIMGSGQKPKRGLTPGLGGGSMAQRLIIVVVGAVVLLLLVIILFSVIFKSSGSSSVQLTDLAQQQTEIARVADIGVNKAVSPATQNFAHTTKLSLLSSQQQTIALLQKSGHKLNAKQLGLKNNSVTDQQLNAASANSNFDATFTKLMTDELTAYRTSLQTDYKTSTSLNEKQLLQTNFNSVTILIGDNQTF